MEEFKWVMRVMRKGVLTAMLLLNSNVVKREGES
jgi:hypothetical protein